MKTADLRKSLFLSAKVLNLTRALGTFEVGRDRGSEGRKSFAFTDEGEREGGVGVVGK